MGRRSCCTESFSGALVLWAGPPTQKQGVPSKTSHCIPLSPVKWFQPQNLVAQRLQVPFCNALRYSTWQDRPLSSIKPYLLHMCFYHRSCKIIQDQLWIMSAWVELYNTAVTFFTVFAECCSMICGAWRHQLLRKARQAQFVATRSLETIELYSCLNPACAWWDISSTEKDSVNYIL